MFDRALPEIFATSVAGQVESEQRVVRLAQLLPQLDEELLPLERDLDNLAPAERVDLDVVLKDDQSDGGDSQLDVSAVGVLAVVQTDPVHLQPLGVLQEVELGLGGTLALVQLVQLCDSSAKSDRKRGRWELRNYYFRVLLSIS